MFQLFQVQEQPDTFDLSLVIRQNHKLFMYIFGFGFESCNVDLRLCLLWDRHFPRYHRSPRMRDKLYLEEQNKLDWLTCQFLVLFCSRCCSMLSFGCFGRLAFPEENNGSLRKIPKLEDRAEYSRHGLVVSLIYRYLPIFPKLWKIIHLDFFEFHPPISLSICKICSLEELIWTWTSM